MKNTNQNRPAFLEPIPNKSILGKRKLVDAFGPSIYNEEMRYGQSIPPDFFKTNVGHNCYYKKS